MMMFKKKVVEEYKLQKVWDIKNLYPLFQIVQGDVVILSSHNCDFVKGFATRLTDSGHIVHEDESLLLDDYDLQVVRG